LPIRRDKRIGQCCDVRYPSVSLSSTLSRNEKVEQHIRKKTHKPNALRFWVEGGVILLLGWALVSFSFDLPCVSPVRFLSKWYQSRWFVMLNGSDEYNLIRVLKVFMVEILDKRVLFKCVNDDTSEDRL